MKHISEYRPLGGYVIHKHNIIGTNFIVYNAWEPSSVTGKHSTITTVNGIWYGKIGTSRVPPEIDALPAGSEERIRRVHLYFDEEYARAYRLIVEAFPEAAESRSRVMGEIETLGSSSVALKDRSVPQTYADWVQLGDEIKASYAEVNNLGGIETVSFNLDTISHEGLVPPIETNEAIANAKRWLLLAAGRLR